jgi:hypothetical protein
MATAKNVKPTTKNSPKITLGKAPYNKPASDYAKPHTMTDGPVDYTAAISFERYGNKGSKIAGDKTSKDPVDNVSIGANTVKNQNGEIEMRGAGAATKGRMMRGPRA